MNTDIHFQISAPASLSIFGEYTENRLKASMDLCTTLTFQEVPAPLSNFIEMYIPQINLFHTISFQTFSNLYSCVENTELLHERIQLTFQYESINQKIFLQIFYYLIVLITYKEQIKIKSFIIILNTQLTSNGEFMSLASLKVCLVACLLHWSRLQKGTHSTFDEADLKQICDYAMCCEKFGLKSDLIDIMVCTYGSLVKEKEQYKYKGFQLPSMMILLVDSNQTPNVEIQKQEVSELINMFPELANSILNNFDDLTNVANNIFQTIFDIYKNNELDIETKNLGLSLQHKALEVSHNMNSIKKCYSVVYLCIVTFSVLYFFILLKNFYIVAS